MADYLTQSEAFEMGRALRAKMGRRQHVRMMVDDRDPVAILEEQNATRLPHLVPVRMGRMLQSPFAYYRGTAAVMAHDLSREPRTGTMVVACGDAHISNFGLFASPERKLLFDLNDFDEASVAPWEWDVKRLAASAAIGARDNDMSDHECRDAGEAAVRGYREGLARLYSMSALERYHFHADVDAAAEAASGRDRKLIESTVKKARKRTSQQVIEKITVRDEAGAARIVDQPPVMEHVGGDDIHDEVLRILAEYRATLRPDVALLASQFRLTDFVRRVVGVGSVGTRCFVLLLEGPAQEPLFLQVKEAGPSVLETYGGIPWVPPAGIAGPASGREGHRVVTAQRILQAQSDPFLGWIAGGGDGGEGAQARDYFWRQFRDMKGSFDIAAFSADQFLRYVAVCGGLLARAHSQSPAGAVIAGYLGESDNFDVAVTSWAMAYADQTERDFTALEQAVKSGRVEAEPDI